MAESKNLCSRSDGLDNLGKSGKAWNNVYAKQVYAANGLSVGGTDISNTYLKKTDATSTYLTKTDATSTYLTKTDANAAIPTKTSQLTNDSNYVAFSDGKALEVGNYIDLHTNNDMTSDYTFRIMGNGTLQLSGSAYIGVNSSGHLIINGSEVWVE